MSTLKLAHFGTQPRNDKGYVADRNLYLDADDNLVEEDNPAQTRQLVGKGGAISTETAEKYGLLGKKAKAAKAEATDSEQASSESDDATPAKKTDAKKGAKK